VPADRLVTIAWMPGTAGRIRAPGGAAARGRNTSPLTIARKLKSLIDTEPNMRAMLTRDGDYFIDLGRASRRRSS